MDETSAKIITIIKECIDIKNDIMSNLIPQIISIVGVIVQALSNGKKIILFGNGGSAADAQHLAGEFVSKFYIDRQPLPAIAINTNTSIITAIANDFGYEYVFSRQIEGLVNDGDVVIGISTSGTSINVIKAIKKANELGATTVCFTGITGNELVKISNEAIQIMSDNTPRIQEAYLTIGHIICELVEEDILALNRH